jgi:hypothetical protein
MLLKIHHLIKTDSVLFGTGYVLIAIIAPAENAPILHAVM